MRFWLPWVCYCQQQRRVLSSSLLGWRLLGLAEAFAKVRDVVLFDCAATLTICVVAMCSIPELMPNKYRHIGIALSDGFVFLIVIIGPVVGRYAIDTGDGWKYIYYGGFVAQ